MKITLAKALKLKNRLANKTMEVSRSIHDYNSVIEGKERPVDISALIQKREKLVDALINLKTAINSANTPVQKTIYLLAELKGEISFLRGIDTSSGKQMNGIWGDNVRIYNTVAILDYATVKGLTEEAEASIDANQDLLDKHNHTVELDIDDGVFTLLRG